MTDEAPKRPGYGLILKRKTNVVKPTLDSMAAAARPSVFDGGDDSDGNDTNDKEKSSAKREVVCTSARLKASDVALRQKALEEDPHAFDYDAVYDVMVAEKQKKVDAQTANADKERKPKYIDQLLKAQKKRELETHAREERKQQKERATEGGQFKDKEVFVTGAYRKQMEEVEIYREEMEHRDALEAMMDVTKQKDLSGFYRNHLAILARDGTPSTSSATTAVIKTEPKDAEPTAKEADKKEHTKKAAPVNKTNKGTVEDHKKKSYRRRRADSSSDSEGDGKRREKRAPSPPPDKKHKSIYSDSSGEESVPKADTAPRKAGLQVMAKRSHDHRSGETQRERQRKRFFTPSPPPASDKQQKQTPPSDDKPRRVKNEQKESRADVKTQRRTSESSGSKSTAVKKPDEEETDAEKWRLRVVKSREDQQQQRMDRLKKSLARKADADTIDSCRRRYFTRLADKQIVPPIV